MDTRYVFTGLLLLSALTASAQERIEYPYSLVPGGVQNDSEFEQARDSGRLAEHYADVGFLRPEYLPADRAMWASYTRNGRIYWARVTVHKGELVLKDRYGNAVRGRCGNRLSDVPREPVEFVAPKPREFEIPHIAYAEPPVIVPPVETIDFPAVDPPIEENPEVPLVPLGPFIPGLPPPPFTSEGSHNTPEPATVFLTFLSLSIVAGFKRYNARNSHTGNTPGARS